MKVASLCPRYVHERWRCRSELQSPAWKERGFSRAEKDVLDSGLQEGGIPQRLKPSVLSRWCHA